MWGKYPITYSRTSESVTSVTYKAGYLRTSVSFSESGGITTSGSKTLSSGSHVSCSSYRYYTFTDGSGYLYAPTSSYYWYRKSSSYIYRTSSSGTSAKYDITKYTVTSSHDTLDGYAASGSSDTYPTDGSSGSIYYVYVGADSIDPEAVSYSSSNPKGEETLTVTLTESSTNTAGGTITYTWEYSTDGGSTWTELASTTDTSVSMTVPESISQLQVRVLAADDYGFTSTDYVAGDNIPVRQNVAPEAPASIQVPLGPVGGETAAISWDAAEDVDENVTGYELERRIDGTGDWTQIYSGSDTACTDSIEASWDTVAYRVRAVDAKGLYSGYTESGNRAVSAALPAVTAVSLTPNPVEVGESYTVAVTAALVAKGKPVKTYYSGEVYAGEV